MLDSHTRRGAYAYRPIVIALVIALVGSLIPPEGWGELIKGCHVAYADDLDSGLASFRSEVANDSLALSPISISRLQSAYTPGALVSGALVVTFTVTNHQLPTIVPHLPEGATLTDTVAALQAVDLSRDPNVIHNVLLVDSPAVGVTLAASTPRFDHKDGQHTWNLGDIPPLGSLTVTLVTSAPAALSGVTALDTGAKVWGTFQNRPVHAQACPVTLTPDTLDGQPMGEYLRPTVDANWRDEYVARFAGQMCPDPLKAFEYVRTLGYEAYTGSLRGARGTLWSGAGNSLDKASLLAAALRANGTPARYRHGVLSTERAQELILSMFPATPRVVGYVPEGAEVSDPANDAGLLAEAREHWWVEAYRDGTWIALDPSFRYAAPGQALAAPEGEPLAEAPDALRHKVTVRLKVERYDMLTYLYAGLVYTTPLSYTFTTAELVGQPLTLKHLVSVQRPPSGCLVEMICWKHHTYIPYLRVGDNPWVIQGHPFWELLSSYPFGQSAITAEWLIFDVRDAEGHVKTYTRELADRIGVDKRAGDRKMRGLIPRLLTAEVLDKFGLAAPALASELDNHTIYFNPSLMSPEYAAHVGENLLAAAPRVLSVQPLLPKLMDEMAQGQRPTVDAAVQLADAAELAVDTTQAFNRLLGAAFVTFSDAASRDLAETGLVRAYPDSPRLTLVSMIISPTRVMTEAVPIQVMDLLHDSLRVIAYPGQVKGAEPVYRMTRGMNEAFLEKLVGEQFAGQSGRSAAGVLQAASAQGIPLMYVDAQRLEMLADAPISEQAKARIAQATQQGYGILAPEQMVTWNGRPMIAWWQLDLNTGEMIDVSEDGMHQQMIIEAAGGKFVFLAYARSKDNIIKILRQRFWVIALGETWNYFWLEALQKTKSPAPEEFQQEYQAAFRDTKRHMETVWRLLCKGPTLTTVVLGEQDCKRKLW